MSSKGVGQYLEEEKELRRGPWTLEEDTLLNHYITRHSEGRWNLLAKCSGLKRTGKSCRLRWLNYLKPDLKRGNLTPEEQILILELHSKWGNRWSRIAQHLPGRTDNEIKNYWRTRVQKQARQLKIDENSMMFQDTLQYFWMPSLLQKVRYSAVSQSLNKANTSAIQAPQPPLQGLLSTEKGISFENSSGCEHPRLENCSPSLRSGAMVITHLPQISENQATPRDSYGNYNLYNPLLNGDNISNGYNMDTLDLAFAPTSAVIGFPASDCSMIGSMLGDNCINSMEDGLWNMDESWH